MDAWLLRNKAKIGYVVTTLSGGIAGALSQGFVSGKSWEFAVWALSYVGALCIGGGVMKSDQYYKDKLENK